MQLLQHYAVCAATASKCRAVLRPTPPSGRSPWTGTAIAAGNFTAIPGSGYSGALLTVALGSHHLVGSLPFGITVYGFNYAESYGYAGGITLEPLPVPTGVALTPKTATHTTGNQHCSRRR